MVADILCKSVNHNHEGNKMTNSQKIVKISFSGERLDVTLSQPSNGVLLKKWIFEDEVERITRGLNHHEFSVTWITQSIF